MVDTLEDWRWSNYPIVTGQEAAPRWLDTDWLLGQFAPERGKAIQKFREFVMSGRGVPSPLQGVRHQLLLGDDGFVVSHRQTGGDDVLREVSKAHRKSLALPLDQYQSRYTSRDEVMAQAYLSGAYSMAEIGNFFRVHYMTVSRAVRKFEATQKEMLEC